MTPKFSICSYSFRRSFESGEMDYRDYVDFNQSHGFSQLDPWMKHVEPALVDRRWLADAQDNGRGRRSAIWLPRGGRWSYLRGDCGPARLERREMAYRWLDVAESLSASQMRIDSGGPEELTDEIFEIIVDGYNDLIPRARSAGVEIVVREPLGAHKSSRKTQFA